MAVSETARLIASLELKDLFSKQVDNATKSLGKLDTKLDSTQGRAYKAGQQIGTGIKRGLAVAVTAIGTAALVGGTVFAKAIQSASDLNESVSKVGVVFGKSAAQVLAFGKTAAASLGLSQQAADEAAGTFGNLFTAMGFTQKKSADMSIALVKLAGDLASFNNIDPAEALEKLRSGLTGEFEPLKTLGVNINETILKAEALKLGLIKGGSAAAATAINQEKLALAQHKYAEAVAKSGKGSDQARAALIRVHQAQDKLNNTVAKVPGVLTPAQKAQAAYALILEQTKTAQGDFNRTQGGLANQTRILKANWEDLKATLATPALPKIALIFQRINAALKENQPAVARLGDTIASFFTKENIDAGFGVIKSGIDTLVAAAPILTASAKATLGFVQAGVAIFNSLPDPIKALAVGGFALNKLTGGLVTNVGGALLDLIGKSRGASPANPVFVSDVSGGIGGTVGKAAGLGGLAAISALASVAGLEVFLADQIRQVVNPGSSGELFQHHTIDEQIAHHTGQPAPATQPIPVKIDPQQLNEIKPSAILDRGGREQGFNVLAGKIRDDANFIADTMRAISSRERAAIEDLKHTTDPKKVQAALKAVQEIMIAGGHGSVKATLETARAIREQLKHTHDPVMQAALRSALKAVEGKIPGREYAQRQIAKADQILRSGRSTEDKIKGLQAIERDLKDHKLPGQTRALQAKIDALKASQAAKLDALRRVEQNRKAQVVIQNQIDAVAKIDSKVLGREVRRVSRLYAIPV